MKLMIFGQIKKEVIKTNKTENKTYYIIIEDWHDVLTIVVAWSDNYFLIQNYYNRIVDSKRGYIPLLTRTNPVGKISADDQFQIISYQCESCSVLGLILNENHDLALEDFLGRQLKSMSSKDGKVILIYPEKDSFAFQPENLSMVVREFLGDSYSFNNTTRFFAEAFPYIKDESGLTYNDEIAAILQLTIIIENNLLNILYDDQENFPYDPSGHIDIVYLWKYFMWSMNNPDWGYNFISYTYGKLHVYEVLSEITFIE